MRSRRLAMLERLAAMAERSARLRLAQVNQDVQRKLQQQRQLEEYDAEYAARWLAAGRSGLGGQRLLQLGAFRESLARTLTTQASAVGQARTALAREAAQWRGTRERLRVFSELVENAGEHEQRERDRRTQRVLDDLAANTRREP